MTDHPPAGDHDGHEKIEKFFSLDEMVDKHAATMEILHAEAYTTAARKVLMKDGLVDMSLLKDKDMQNVFIETMTGAYLDGIPKSYSGDHRPTDVLMRSLWMEGYTGLSQGTITRLVRDQMDRYTLQQHMNLTVYSDESIVKDKIGRMRFTALGESGLAQADVPSIVKYIKIEDRLDASKLKLAEATNLLRVYKREGAIANSMIDRLEAYKKPADDHTTGTGSH